MSRSMKGHVGKITAEIAGWAVRYARQCMCPVTKYEFAHEGGIGGVHWDYSCLAVDKAHGSVICLLVTLVSIC